MSFLDKESEDLRVKYLVSLDRKKHISKFNETSSEKLELNSKNLDKIIGAYNGFTLDSKRTQLKRDVER